MFDRKFHTIAVVAPAGPLAPEKAERGLAFLEAAGKRVRVMPQVFGGDVLPYLAAPAVARAADLTAAWLDPEVDLILCARGGYGSCQILPYLDWERLKKRPAMPVVGYSDITALHFAMTRFGAGEPVAAPMLGKLAEAFADDYVCREWNALWEDGTAETPLRLPTGERLRFLRSGRVTAEVLVGNLAVAASLCGTPFLPSAAGRIVILEDLNEAPYRIDRYLTQLNMSGFFADCAGIAFGGFLDCGAAGQLERLFRRALDWTAGPVATGFPFSHGLPLLPLRFSRKLTLASE